VIVESQLDRGVVSARDRILVAAAARFAELGYSETSLRLIAGDVDMKAGSLYYHFASKDDLILSVLSRGIGLMMDAFTSIEEVGVVNDGDETDGRARLGAHVVAHLRVLHGNFDFTSLHVNAFRTAPAAIRAAIVPERDEYEAKWTRLLRSILPRPSDEEIRILRLVLFGAMNSSIEWFDAERGGLDAFAELITDQFWYGVG
jgi:AcrR family transcriptional regulator